MTNAAAFASLDAFRERVRTAPAALPAIAAAAAPEIERILRSNIAAGVAPNGKPWPETADGHRALQNAMDAISVRAVEATIVITVNGVEARHHLGAVKGGVRRELIPTGEMPQPLLDALSRVTGPVLARHFGGAR